MDSREDKLVALIGLLSAGLVAVVVLFTLTWLSDVRYSSPQPLDVRICVNSTDL